MGEKERALIAGIVPSSFTDGPGNRMVVFFQGCNLRCRYCQNPETWDITGKSNPLCKWVKLGELLEFFTKFSDFLSGITFSGGEALLQWEFLKEFSKKFKEVFPEKTILVDTNCDVNPQIIREIVDYVDYFTPDIKAPIKEIYEKLTGGVGNFSNLLSNLKFLNDKGKIYEVRLPIIPGYTDTIEVYRKWIEIIKTLFNKKIRIRIIKFRNHGVKDQDLKSKGVDESKIELLIYTLRKEKFDNIVNIK